MVNLLFYNSFINIVNLMVGKSLLVVFKLFIKFCGIFLINRFIGLFFVKILINEIEVMIK